MKKDEVTKKMLFFGKNKRQNNNRPSDVFFRVNDWCVKHESEVMEIRNYIQIEISQGRKPTSALIEEAFNDREITMPFSAKDLIKYSVIKFF